MTDTSRYGSCARHSSTAVAPAGVHSIEVAEYHKQQQDENLDQSVADAQPPRPQEKSANGNGNGRERDVIAEAAMRGHESDLRHAPLL